MVVNDTRVLAARLFARRAATGARVEVLLAERRSATEWEALARPGRRARPGERLLFDDGLEAEVLAKGEDGRHLLRFSAPVEPHLERHGHVPLPPYIKRPDAAADREDYQTIFARHPGAIAAPTAGLHFTPELVAALASRGVELQTLTLHVGLGTFKPVTSSLVHEHRMDAERFEIPRATELALRRDPRRRRTRGGGRHDRGARPRGRGPALRRRGAGGPRRDRALHQLPAFASRSWTRCSPTSTCRAPPS